MTIASRIFAGHLGTVRNFVPTKNTVELPKVDGQNVGSVNFIMGISK